MLRIDVTKNYVGVNIGGDYDDLDKLYDSIHYLIQEDSNSIEEYTMQNHLYAFLYEVRHAYQGSRGVESLPNGLTDEAKKYYHIKKGNTDNIYYSFQYTIPDLLLDMVLVKYFISKVDKKENDIFNPYLNLVNLFYSLVLDAFLDILSLPKYNKLKKGILNSKISKKNFFPQWFQIITCNYLNSPKEKRLKNFMKTAEAIYNYNEFDDYYDMKLRIEKTCKEKNCTIDDFYYENYPSDLEW